MGNDNPSPTGGADYAQEIKRTSRRTRRTSGRTDERQLMTIEKLGRNCAYAIAEFVNDGSGEFLYVQRYFGYTKNEAVKLFREDIKRFK